jgi:type IV pilus biogenesis protein CpaD/CtpE
MPLGDSNVNVQLWGETKALVDALAASHKMTRKQFIHELVVWMNGMSKSERAIVLGQVSEEDQITLAELILQRHQGSRAAERARSMGHAAAARAHAAGIRRTQAGRARRNSADKT